MPVQITATLEGVRELDVYLGTVESEVKDFREPLTKIGSEMLKTFDLNFQERGALFGGWAPRRKSVPWPLLEKTGKMRNSFTKETTRDSVTLTNTAPYFPYHQSKAPRRKLPRRVMIAIDQARRVFITKTFQSHMVESLRGRK